MNEQKHYRIIFNNDGGDVLCPQASTPEGFLGLRTKLLEGTQIDAISYCTHSAFNYCQHKSKIGELVDYKSPTNHVQTLIDSGRDCLEIVTNWAHDSGIDAFWSMRMNDCHDGKLPQFRSKFKLDHPEYLVGREEDREGFAGDYRWWSAVNYAIPEVRQRAFELIEEVCQNYDVDGIELDFNRHTIYFPEQREGKPATAEHIQMMTELLRRVRKMANSIGKERGRPIIIAARTLDALDLSQHIGIDVKAWVQEKLLDILIPGDYWQFTDWKQCIDLGHQHGVLVYPCISATRIHSRCRDSLNPTAEDMAMWRGDAMNIWNAGADGIHIFNGSPVHTPLWSEIGDPEVLKTMDLLYAPTQGSWTHIDTWYGSGTRDRYGQYPADLTANQETKRNFYVGEQVNACQLKLRIRLLGLTDHLQMVIKLNGQTLNGLERISTPDSERYADELWLETSPKGALIKHGRNEISVMVDSSAITEQTPAMLAGVHLYVCRSVPATA